MAFRLFKHEWIGTDYPNHNELDVKDCIQKLIDPLVAGGCGWIWDETHCPNQEPIALAPSTRVYAAFIKHTSGAKAMIGYSLNGIRVNQTTDGTCTSDGTFFDAGLLRDKIRFYNDSSVQKIMGLFFSFITSDSVNNDNADFHTEYPTTDENFYDAKMSPIIPLISMNNDYTSSQSVAKYQDYASDNIVYCAPMIQRVQNENQCCHYLIADTDYPVIYLGSKGQGKTILSCLFGEIATNKKRYDYDIASTSKFVCLTGTNYVNLGGYNIETSAFNVGEENYGFYVSGSSGDSITTYRCENIMFNIENNSIETINMYSVSNHWMTTNPRTASYIQTERGIFNENIRTCFSTNLNIGQVYGNGEWCYIGGGQYSYTNPYYVDSVNSKGIIIKWDSEFNQGNRLV